MPTEKGGRKVAIKVLSYARKKKKTRTDVQKSDGRRGKKRKMHFGLSNKGKEEGLIIFFFFSHALSHVPKSSLAAIFSFSLSSPQDLQAN